MNRCVLYVLTLAASLVAVNCLGLAQIPDRAPVKPGDDQSPFQKPSGVPRGDNRSVIPGSVDRPGGGDKPTTRVLRPETRSQVLQNLEGVQSLSNELFIIADPRPLHRVADFLERKLGVPISYEEPAWASSADLVAAADLPTNRDLALQNSAWRGPLVPRGGSVTVILPSARSSDPGATIQAAIDDHRIHRNPGEFKLLRFGTDEFSIVAERAQDKNGKPIAPLSPLDSRISVSQEPRTLAATIDQICAALSRGGTKVIRGVVPADFDRLITTFGSQNEKARDTLSRFLRVSGRPKTSWRLVYDATSGYSLNLLVVRTEAAGPSRNGLPLLRVAIWP